MIIKRQIGEKGQVVIPKDIREYLKLNLGSDIIFEIKNNEVFLKKERNDNFLDDFLNVPKLKRKVSWKKMKEGLEERHEIH